MGKPTYDLEQLQQLVGQGELTRSITESALNGGAPLGFGVEEIVEAVLLLEERHFYKTMESTQIPGLWQDVYHLQHQGEQLYIKLQMGLNGRAYVVQFKRK
jgi:hypothetical protein